MTLQGFSPIFAAMDSELKAVEDGVRQLVGLCGRLRSENVELRRQLATAQSDNKQLRDRAQLAADRLEALLARLPG